MIEFVATEKSDSLAVRRNASCFRVRNQLSRRPSQQRNVPQAGAFLIASHRCRQQMTSIGIPTRVVNAESPRKSQRVRFVCGNLAQESTTRINVGKIATV